LRVTKRFKDASKLQRGIERVTKRAKAWQENTARSNPTAAKNDREEELPQSAS